MTTKNKLREALQRIVNTWDEYDYGPMHFGGEFMGTIEAARAILARPAVVVGYVVRDSVDGVSYRVVKRWRIEPWRPEAYIKNVQRQAHEYRREWGGVVRKLVVR